MNPRVRKYWNLLRNLPAEVMLGMGSVPIEPTSNTRCVCAWALRADMAKEAGVYLAEVPSDNVPEYSWLVGEQMAKRYGGAPNAWVELYLDAAWASTSFGDDVETAFTMRLMECVR